VNVVPGTPPVSVSAAAAFSIVSPPGAVGEALARWAHEQGSRKAVVLAGPDDYGMAFRAAVDAEFQRVGGQVVAAEDYESHQSQVQIDPQKIAASRPDVIISALPGGEARMLFAQTTVLGLQVPWYVAYPSAMVADGPIQADGRVFGVEVGYTTEVAQKFREAYAARYPGARATPWSAHSYDAIWIGARAKIRDGTTDAKRLARVYALVTPGYAGATGSVAFDRNGVRTNPSFDRLRLTTDGLVPAQ
jgi:branched-chain amino acid transport system substrate-binding protein